MRSTGSGSLTSPDLIVAIGHTLALGAETAPWASLFLGRTFVLAVFNAAVFIGIGLVKDGRLTRGFSLHVLLLACAAYAAASPAIADLATNPGTLAIGASRGERFAVVGAALAQAGLWVQTHLVTGALLDALRGRRPTRRAAYHHAGEGLVRGAVFGGFFMALIQGIALCLALPGVDAWLRAAPLFGVALAGGLLFALARTVVEASTGARRSSGASSANALDPVNVLRGLVVGAGLGLAAAWALPSLSDAERTGFGLLVGAAAYAGWISSATSSRSGAAGASVCARVARLHTRRAARRGRRRRARLVSRCVSARGRDPQVRALCGGRPGFVRRHRSLRHLSACSANGAPSISALPRAA